MLPAPRVLFHPGPNWDKFILTGIQDKNKYICKIFPYQLDKIKKVLGCICVMQPNLMKLSDSFFFFFLPVDTIYRQLTSVT